MKVAIDSKRGDDPRISLEIHQQIQKLQDEVFASTADFQKLHLIRIHSIYAIL